MSSIPTIYFDRGNDSIDGFLTVQVFDSGEIKPRFKRMRARSGQKGYTSTSWLTAKSPIPYGDHWLWTQSIKPEKWPGDVDNIGEFFPISTTKTNKDIIKKQGSWEYRSAIGLHPENQYPGSAGCIVMPYSSAEEKAWVASLFDYFRELDKLGIHHVPLRVL